MVYHALCYILGWGWGGGRARPDTASWHHQEMKIPWCLGTEPQHYFLKILINCRTVQVRKAWNHGNEDGATATQRENSKRVSVKIEMSQTWPQWGTAWNG